MLQPIFLLRTDARGATALELTKRRALFRQTVCVPRRLCVFESVPCKGLAWHERRSFARLQAQRLAPYSDTGCSAVVRGGMLMLWLWDRSEMIAALAQSGVAADSVQAIAEPLLLARPIGSGRREVPCHEGIDEQTLVNGAIVASRWLEVPTPALDSAGLLQRPWAWDLIGRAGLDMSMAGPGRAGLIQQVIVLSSLALAAAGLGYASYWGSLLWRLESKHDVLQAAVSDTTRQLGDVANLQRAAAQDSDWVMTYQRLGQGMRWPELVQALRPTMELHGVVVREMEVRQDDVRLSVVTAGSAIDLPGLLQSLSSVPGVEDVQLRMNIDVSQATFSLRAAGFMQASDGPRAELK